MNQIPVETLTAEHLKTIVAELLNHSDSPARCDGSSKKAYSIAEAAEALGIGGSHLRTQIRNNRIAVKYIGHKPVILATELDAYLESLPSEPPC